MREIMLATSGFVLATILGCAVAVLLMKPDNAVLGLIAGTLTSYIIGALWYWQLHHKA